MATHLDWTIDGLPNEVRYGYDAAGQGTTLTYPDGSVVARGFDARGQNGIHGHPP